ncbi:MAG: hypothetical protein DRP45_07235 [Candidatus Zixiibacteriota bacterium]|nr:MAG: hypothetical protein DRP45_07235 [candidate division Zixibacteria bacterium]
MMTPTSHIMVLEHNRYRALLLQRELGDRFPLSVVSVFHSLKAALSELRRQNHDIVIVSCEMLTRSGWEILRGAAQGAGLLAIGRQESPETAVATANSLSDEFITVEDELSDGLLEVVDRYVLSGESSINDCGSHDILKRPDCSSVIQLTVNTLTHEINNPLTTILGTTELLLTNGYRLSPEETEKLRIIQESAQRIETALVDLSQIRQPFVKSTPAGPLLNIRRSDSLSEKSPKRNGS